MQTLFSAVLRKYTCILKLTIPRGSPSKRGKSGAEGALVGMAVAPALTLPPPPPLHRRPPSPLSNKHAIKDRPPWLRIASRIVGNLNFQITLVATAAWCKMLSSQNFMLTSERFLGVVSPARKRRRPSRFDDLSQSSCRRRCHPIGRRYCGSTLDFV